eukprot:Sro9_g007620.2  (212) ;mRNA; r:201902-202537
MGSAVASPLQALTAVLWGEAVTGKLKKTLGSSESITEDDLKRVQIGTICGMFSAVFAYLTAHFSILTHEAIHDVVFVLCMIFGWIWCIAVTYYTNNNSPATRAHHNLFDVRRLLLCVNWICILSAALLMEYGRRIKQKLKKKQQFFDKDNFWAEPDSGVASSSRGKVDTLLPWDPCIQRAAILSYVALAAFVGLVISTTVELQQQSFQDAQ